MLYSADRRLVEAAESTERMSAVRPLSLTGTGPGRMQISKVMRPAISLYIYKAEQRAERLLSHSVEVKVTPAERLCIVKSLTVAPEHMDVQLLKEVHDERVDLWQQPHEEDDGKAQSEDCREMHTKGQ